MNTIFTNKFNETVTNQQVKSMTEYQIVHEENGVVKKIEKINTIVENYSKHIKYFKDYLEDYSQVLESLLPQSNSFEIITTEPYINYTIQTSKSYMDNEYAGTIKQLLKNELVICWQEYHYLTEEVINSSTEKYYYDNSEKLLLTFTYTDLGSICLIDGKTEFDPFDGEVRSIDEETFTSYNPNFLIDNPYYTNVDFLPQ